MLIKSIPLRALVRQSPIAFVAVLACVLSFSLTLRFFGQICPDEGHTLWGMGALWESAKIVFSTIGFRDLVTPQYRCRGLCLLVLALMLSAGSVMASLGFVVAADAQGRSEKLAASQHYRRVQGELSAIEKQLGLLVASAEQDMAQGFRTRGLRAFERIESLRQQQAATAAALTGLEGAEHFILTGHGATSEESLRITKRLRLTGQCVLAVMLEVIGMAAMALLGRKDVGPGQRDVQERNSRPDVGFSAANSTAAPPVRLQAYVCRYKEAERLVAQAQLQPCYRALQDAFGVSQSTAQRYLRRMRQQGVLSVRGKGYSLAS